MTYLTRPWTRRLRTWLTIAVATALTGTLTTAAVASPQQQEGFNLDSGNALLGVVYPPFQKAVRTVTPDGSDATLVADHILMTEVAWFDAIAPYHPTAVGIYSNLGRRPKSEATTRNKNTAVIYAAYTSLSHEFPHLKSEFRNMVTSAGLNPDDRGSATTPAGIGRMAAEKVIEARRHDGSNRYGDEGDRKYNQVPYTDYTGYKPVNTATEIRDPSRWQPNLTSKGGLFKAQEYVTPQYGRVKPISYDSPTEFHLDPPVKSDYDNREGYKDQADQMLDASAHLTDRQKMTAEFFNDKIFALGRTAGTAAFQQGHFDIEKSVQYVATADIAIFDAAITSWYFKRKYDAPRPFTAIRYLYGDKNVTAWGGPGKGTVSDMKGKEWRSYLNVADHPEYPSTSSTYCLAWAQAARRFLGTDKLSVSHTMKKGSSEVEPGITPAGDVTLRWDNLTGLANDCRMSRVWGGVHFPAATQNAAQFAPKIGDGVYNFVQRKINGG